MGACFLKRVRRPKVLAKVTIAYVLTALTLLLSCSKSPSDSGSPDDSGYHLRILPRTGQAPLEVTLYATDVIDSSATYSFEFGDGQSYVESKSESPDGSLDGETKHIYWTPGRYVAKSSIKDGLGVYHYSEDTLEIVQRTLEGRIIFRQSVNSDRGEIISMNPFGEDLRSLTGEVFPRMKCIQPNLPTDGTKVVYSLLYALYGRHDYDVWRMNVDGSSKEQLTKVHSDELFTVVSPDGKKIAFLLDGRVYLMNADGSNQRKLPHVNDVNYGQKMSWAPDATRLILIANGDIHSVDSSGGDLTRLTHDADGKGSLSYAPNGTEIAFAKWKGRQDSEVYVMNADGSNQRNISGDSNSVDITPMWSPDGCKIAFSRALGGQYEVWIMNRDGTNQKNLSNDITRNDFVNAWSPSGGYLVYSSWVVGGDRNLTELFVLDTTGLYKKQITDNIYTDEEAVWIR